MQPLSIGIIGTGFGSMIGQIFTALDPACRVYLSGQNPTKTQTIAKRIGAAGTFDTWQELVEDPSIDLVIIASPNVLHQPMFELAVKNHKHILLEKPAALTAADVAQMQQLTRGYEQVIAINHEARFSPIVAYIKQLVADGRLGSILTVRIGAYINAYSNPDFRGSWYNDKEQGGGQLYSMGTHVVDLARFLLDMDDIVSGHVQTKLFPDPRFDKPATAETQFSAQFLTGSGTAIDLFNDTYCFGYKDFKIDVIGSQGIALYSDQLGLRTSFANDQPPEQITVKDPLQQVKYGNSVLTKSMKFAVQALIASVRSGHLDPKFCTLGQARQNLSILERFTSST